MPDLTTLDLDTAAGGAAPELFEHELQNVLKNIRDPNTSAKEKREITLTFKFEPKEDKHGVRNEMVVTCQAKTKLAPVVQASSFAFISRQRDGEGYTAHTNDVRQEEIEFDPATGEEKEGVTPIESKTRQASPGV